MILPRFGEPEVFEQRDVETPRPGPGDLLVRVIAAGTNPVEAKIRRDGYGSRLETPAILGYDVSGVVEETGPGVTGFSPGEAVFYTPEIGGPRGGGYAEFNVVPAAIVARKPRNLGHIEAAAIPLAGGTAYEAIVRRLKVSVGESVLIHGGAGGVGSFAIQIARTAGARVLASASTDNQSALRELGVDVPIDYQRHDPFAIAGQENGGAGVDAVFDTVGGDIIQRSLPATRRFGRLAGILGAQGDLTLAYRRNQTYYGVMLTRERPRLEILAALAEQEKIRPVIDKVLPLEDVAEAHRRLDSRHGRGKMILKIGD
jgi:NADPH2:quinone reductase